MSEKWGKYGEFIAKNNKARNLDQAGKPIPSIDKSLELNTLGQGVHFTILAPEEIEALSEEDRSAYDNYIKQKEQQRYIRGKEFDKLRTLRPSSTDRSESSSGVFYSGTTLDPLDIIKKIDAMEAEMSGEWFGKNHEESHEEPFAVSYQNFVGMPLNLKLHNFSYYKDRLAEVLSFKTGTNGDVGKGEILMKRLEDALQAKAEAEISFAIAAAEHKEEVQDTIYSGPEEVDSEGVAVISGEPNFVDVKLPVLENSFVPTQYPLVDSTKYPEADTAAMGHYREAMLKAEESSKLVEATFLAKIKDEFKKEKVSEVLKTVLSARLAVEVALKLTEGNLKKLNRVAPSSEMKASVEEDFARLTERQKTLNKSVLENRGVNKYIEDSELLGLEIQILDSLKSEFSNEQMHAVRALFMQKKRELEEMFASLGVDAADQETQSRRTQLEQIQLDERKLPPGAFPPSDWGVRRRGG